MVVGRTPFEWVVVSLARGVRWQPPFEEIVVHWAPHPSSNRQIWAGWYHQLPFQTTVRTATALWKGSSGLLPFQIGRWYRFDKFPKLGALFGLLTELLIIYSLSTAHSARNIVLKKKVKDLNQELKGRTTTIKILIHNFFNTSWTPLIYTTFYRLLWHYSKALHYSNVHNYLNLYCKLNGYIETATSLHHFIIRNPSF
jgi:hypothetical protein